MSGDEIARQVWALMVTRGGEGSVLYEDGQAQTIPACKARKIKDPTGCGDAYRAGVIHGILNDMDLATACRIGSVLGAIKIEHQAPQHHSPEPQEIRDRFEEAYGYRFD
jgi:adenosine kinase